MRKLMDSEKEKRNDGRKGEEWRGVEGQHVKRGSVLSESHVLGPGV